MGKELSKKQAAKSFNAAFRPGKPMKRQTRKAMESFFNHDFSHVRIFNDHEGARRAEEQNANAFTTGSDIVFGSGKYQPGSTEGNKLLVHELAHVVQQARPRSVENPEASARKAEDRYNAGKTVSPGMLGGAPTGLYKQEKEGKSGGKSDDKKKEVKVDVEPEKVAKPEPKKGEKGKEPPASSKMPSRLPVPWLSSGSFSLGLRLGFPKPELGKGLGPNPLKESLAKAKLMNQVLSGKVPSGWEATDKGKLAEAVWGIFSTQIAPDLASKVTSGLTSTTESGNLSYELDAILITDFSKEIGGGLSFTLKWK